MIQKFDQLTIFMPCILSIFKRCFSDDSRCQLKHIVDELQLLNRFIAGFFLVGRLWEFYNMKYVPYCD